MYYNLKGFGDALKQIRHTQRITQKYISDKVSINLETLRKIENGLVLPKQETLDLLSSALNVDIAALFLTYRMENYSILEDLKRDLDFHLDDGDYILLKKDLTKLKDLATYNMNVFFKTQVLQLVSMTEGFLIGINTADYAVEISCYIHALAYTIPDFDLSNYKNYYYNELEIRLLMNIALAKYNQGSTEECIALLEFCVQVSKEYSSMTASNLFSKLHYNMSYTFHRIDMHAKALEHATLGIQYAINNRSMVFLAHLYYRKGIAQYYLGQKDYLDSLQYAKNLFFISNHLYLHDKMVESCKVHYNIIL